MWPYWVMFLCVAIPTVSPVRGDAALRRFSFVIVFLVLTALIGFRHEVGADWDAYQFYFELTTEMTLIEALAFGDPFYYFLNWIIAQLGGEIYLVNFLCGGLLLYGVFRLIHQHVNPWLALTVAVPYLLIVVGMGYTRQAAALGPVMIGFAALEKQQVRKFVFWVLLGALFHKSAIAVLPIAAIVRSRRRLLNFLWVGIVSAIAAIYLLIEHIGYFTVAYIDANLASQGAMTRVGMNALAALGFLVLRSHLPMSKQQRSLWIPISYMSLAMLPLVPLASTAVDRVTLYFIPLQLVFFANLPLAFKGKHAAALRAAILASIVFYYGIVQFVWLTMASHSDFWLPYRFQLSQ